MKSNKEAAWQYHHMGIPTRQVQPVEKYSSTFRMYTTPGDNLFRIQWHRYEPGCPLHPLIQRVPHVAFKVESIDDAIAGYPVLLAPYYPFDGFRVTMIEVEGAPVELIETSLGEEQIWRGSKSNSLIYPCD